MRDLPKNIKGVPDIILATSLRAFLTRLDEEAMRWSGVPVEVTPPPAPTYNEHRRREAEGMKNAYAPPTVAPPAEPVTEEPLTRDEVRAAIHALGKRLDDYSSRLSSLGLRVGKLEGQALGDRVQVLEVKSNIDRGVAKGLSVRLERLEGRLESLADGVLKRLWNLESSTHVHVGYVPPKP